MGTSAYVKEISQEVEKKMSEKKRRGRPAATEEQKAAKKAAKEAEKAAKKAAKEAAKQEAEATPVTPGIEVTEMDAAGNVIPMGDEGLPQAAVGCCAQEPQESCCGKPEACEAVVCEAAKDIDDSISQVAENAVDSAMLSYALLPVIEQYGVQRVLDAVAVYKHFENKCKSSGCKK